MILIIGGRGQGKADYARKLLADAGETDDSARRVSPADGGKTDDSARWVSPADGRGTDDGVRRVLSADGREADHGAGQALIVDGETDSWALAAGARGILNFHEMIRRMLAEGVPVEDVIRRILRQPPLVITMDEVGCGIVPVGEEQRRYRDVCGRAGQRLAAQADTVIRMVCGIPVCIKGSLAGKMDGGDGERVE